MLQLGPIFATVNCNSQYKTNYRCHFVRNNFVNTYSAAVYCMELNLQENANQCIRKPSGAWHYGFLVMNCKEQVTLVCQDPSAAKKRLSEKCPQECDKYVSPCHGNITLCTSSCI